MIKYNKLNAIFKFPKMYWAFIALKQRFGLVSWNELIQLPEHNFVYHIFAIDVQ